MDENYFMFWAIWSAGPIIDFNHTKCNIYGWKLLYVLGHLERSCCKF